MIFFRDTQLCASYMEEKVLPILRTRLGFNAVYQPNSNTATMLLLSPYPRYVTVIVDPETQSFFPKMHPKVTIKTGAGPDKIAIFDLPAEKKKFYEHLGFKKD